MKEMVKILFTSEYCGPCHEIKRILKKKGIKFKEISVDTPEGAALADKYNIRAIPAMVKDGKILEPVDRWFEED